jgi:transposase
MMKQVRQRHSREFKIRAVELANQNGNIQEVSEQLKINRETLRLWRKLYREGKLRLDTGPVEKPKSKEEIELANLKKELYEIKMERDILKKAVGIFSKSDK